MESTRDKIKKYIINKIMFESDESLLGCSESLLEKGIVDSLAIVNLVSFVENEFDVKISNDDITIQNFESVEAISNLVEKSLQQQD
ncbi:phosphopantetheine-binding protein [Fulvivirgaceae bacterium BMA10]|uniref:Phosphopantetheine-binding protein n=1 Tax=Splendidivirga corallicola TaxID=3051826 RepID=A0ABT8KNH4_9BACT|nr:phosphopantetheine-binding protein [Fulvivirgaceae bacterium BMA10]